MDRHKRGTESRRRSAQMRHIDLRPGDFSSGAMITPDDWPTVQAIGKPTQNVDGQRAGEANGARIEPRYSRVDGYLQLAGCPFEPLLDDGVIADDRRFEIGKGSLRDIPPPAASR